MGKDLTIMHRKWAIAGEWMEKRFEALWKELPQNEPELCRFAEAFSKWADQLCAKVEREANIVAANQAKVLLVDKMFEYLSLSGKRHRNCIFQVMFDAYLRIRTVELSLMPPMLFLPTPTMQEPKPTQSIQGIFIGENIEGES